MEDECRRAQEDEKLVILSVFDKEARFETNAWNIWKPLSVTIHLEPSDSASRNGVSTVSVDLSVVCSAKYPQVAPLVSLSNGKGISNELVAVLRQKLDKKCTELLGCAMILELCSDVRDFLYENSSAVKGSFHDNMVKNLEERRNEKQRQRLDSEIKDVEQVARIVQERQLHHQEGRREDVAKPKAFLEDAPVRVIAGKTIAVKSSNFGKRQRPHGSCHEWIGVYQNDEVLVSEWTFKFPLRKSEKKKEPNFHEFLKKLDEVEAHLKRFPALTGLDQTVVPYLFCHVDRLSILPRNMNIHVTIGQKIKEAEQSLPSIINSIKHEPTICRRLAGHAVCALRWLHDEGIAHGAVLANCFWVSDNSFRVSDAGTLSLMLSLADVFQKCESGNPVGSQVDEKQSRKKDLFALGTMIDGIRLDQASSNSAASSDVELTKFITACQSAKSVEDLLNMPYLKIDLGAAGSGNSRFGNWHVDDNCRLHSEFIVMKLLGSGGFGEVVLARNKVDDSNYAIKRIPLFAKTDKLNRRITREAKLFAKLNHPNVVRYYSAWIEGVEKFKEGDVSKKPSPGSRRQKTKNDDSMLPTRLRNLEVRGAQFGAGGTGTWDSTHSSFSFMQCSTARGSETNRSRTSAESTSDEEDGNKVETLFDRGDSDDFEICFERSAPGFSQETEEEELEPSSTLPEIKSEAAATLLTVATLSESNVPSRILYIQMEFCGRGTLRSLIDERGLEGNPKTVWRIFREILLGLSYIHRQNMIHRDIKPMNILLDEEDRVKIGDFGLATRDFFRKMDSESTALEMNSKVSGQTRDIGTELYMAPELFDTTGMAPYSSKIDVYSTGIVLFEMFYKPLLHGMERISTLKALKQDISFPEDFGQDYDRNLAKKFIHWMLQEKAENRPTVDVILEDERISVDVDEQMIQNLIQKSVKRGSQTHRNLLNSLLKEEVSGSQNYCFDINQLLQDKMSNRSMYLEETSSQLRRVLAKHCFDSMHCHQLLSSASVQAVAEPRQKPVLLLDSQGFPVALPLDLRQNFARYCCRNEVYRKKRYCIDRVFRNTDGIGFEHPTERWECSIDIVGPTKSAGTLTAELLNVAAEICFTTLPQTNFTLRIGHIGVVIAACRHLNITEEHTKAVFHKLHELSTSNKVFSLSDKTDALSTIPGSRSLLSFLPSEDSVVLLKEACKALLRSRDETVRELTRKALSEIDSVAHILEALEIPHKIKMKFDASLMYRPNTFHDGLLFMIASETSTKKGINRAIVLGGGRYDSSLVRERHPKDSQPKEPLCLIGCSVALDMVVSLRKYLKDKCSPICSAVVCSFSDEFTTEKFVLARRLWSKDVSADIVHDPVANIDDLLVYCELSGIATVLIVFGKDEVLIYSDGAPQGKVNYDEALEHCSPDSDEDNDALSTATTPLAYSKSSSNVNPTANFSNCDVKFAIPDRMSFATRKRVMNSVKNTLPEAVFLFSNKSKIEIIVTELSRDLLKNIAGSISRNTPTEELNILFDGLSRQFGKAKEDLECLFVVLKQLLSPRQESVPIILLLRHQDGFHKVVV